METRRSDSRIEIALRELLERLGGHPATSLGLDLATPPDRARWWVAARLLSEREPEARCLDAFRRLDDEVGADPESLAAASPVAAASALAAAGLRRADTTAGSLMRASSRLGGAAGLESLAAESLDLEELGGRLAALGPGFGAATILRTLRPLRSIWSAAQETPLTDTARAAALHLGLLGEGGDPDTEAAGLRVACDERAPDLDFVDIEAALERLGARACRSGRVSRCPLGDACPALVSDSSSG